MTAAQVYNDCMQSGDLSATEASCLAQAKLIDPNFTGGGGAGGFWQNPNNIVNLFGAAGTAAGQWLPLFGGPQPTAPPQTPVRDEAAAAGIPVWVWILLAIIALIIIVLLILKLSK